MAANVGPSSVPPLPLNRLSYALNSPRSSSPASSPRSSFSASSFFKDHDPLDSPEFTFPKYKVPPLPARKLTQKLRRFRICLITLLSLVGVVWFGALAGYVSKGYFRRYGAQGSPIAVSRRIGFGQVPMQWGRD
jgi:hypothetical protein